VYAGETFKVTLQAVNPLMQVGLQRYEAGMYEYAALDTACSALKMADVAVQ
jgi:hypothetical protein